MTGKPTSTVYLLKRAELAVRGCVEMAFGEASLTPSQYFILFLVSTGEATSSAELSRAMGVLPQSMTEMIGALESRGAIVRRPDKTNNRILRIELTASGERLYATATQIAIRFEQELLAGFDSRELERLKEALVALTATAETHSYHPKLRRLNQPAATLKPVRPLKKGVTRGRTADRR
jgi:DNA-binding MarR family transcriptional regulator